MEKFKFSIEAQFKGGDLLIKCKAKTTTTVTYSLFIPEQAIAPYEFKSGEFEKALSNGLCKDLAVSFLKRVATKARWECHLSRVELLSDEEIKEIEEKLKANTPSRDF